MSRDTCRDGKHLKSCLEWGWDRLISEQYQIKLSKAQFFSCPDRASLLLTGARGRLSGDAWMLSGASVH
jgi:hypothetical protein